MENFSDIINWNSVFKHSETFKKNKPFQFAFIEEFFQRDFYERLYETYPKIDESWYVASDHSKSQLTKYWRNGGSGVIVEEGDDHNYSQEWNRFKRYVHTKEFLENFLKFSGVPVNKVKFFHFMAYRRGGFQLPHIHNIGPSTLIFMVYFSKNWQKGDPGGTYMASKPDESSIIFEPYNLNNSLALFHDGPKAAHGIRYITKDVERRALQITLEEYSPKLGWTGGGHLEAVLKENVQKAKEI